MKTIRAIMLALAVVASLAAVCSYIISRCERDERDWRLRSGRFEQKNFEPGIAARRGR